MHRTIITPAVLAPSALAELKDWLGITLAADDAALAGLLRTALELCEGFTGSVLLNQTCEMVLPVTAGWQGIPVHPVAAITAVEGIPAEGARFVLPVANYAIDLAADGTGRVRIISPGAAGRIAVRCIAGLAEDWTSLPEALRHGVLRLAAHQYRHRDAEGSGPVPPAAVAALWRPWRRLRLA